MSLISTYCGLDEVRKLLRSNPKRGRIRFSDSYSVLRANTPDNTGNIELNSISISTEYYEVADYQFRFLDETTFGMYKSDNENNSEIFLGRGYRQNNFTSNDDMFTVDSTDWIGTIVTGDKILFKTDSHISLDDGTRFINDAELFVDDILEANIRFPDTSEILLFSSGSVPKAIRLATPRIAAYFIYKSIYLEEVNAVKGDSYAQAWLNEGLNALKGYVDKYNLSLTTSVPMIGHSGTNTPMDLDDEATFESSAYNPEIGLLIPFCGQTQESIAVTRAYNFINKSSFRKTVLADIFNSDTPGGYLP